MKIAKSGSFRSIRPYGLTDVGSYLRSLRLVKEKAEDDYWTTALEDGSEKPEDVLAYWEGQKNRFPADSIDYKTYKAKIERIKTTIDTSKVSALIAENKYDDAVTYFQTKVLSKYEKDSPAWSEAFVNLQKIKEAKISYEVGLQDAKLRAKWSVGGLTGRNLVNYYAEMLKYMEDEGYADRAEYFKLVEGQGTAIEGLAAAEKTKETAAYNKRYNELVGERKGAITSKDFVDIYTQLASEFPQGGEGYSNAMENLTKAQATLKTEEEKTKKLQAQVIMNTVLQKYAEGGISDVEYSSALQEMLTLLPRGSEEANEVARALGNLQETLSGKAEQVGLEETRRQIALLEEQENERQYRSLASRLSGKMTAEEETEARQKFLAQIMPLYEKGGGGEADYRIMAKYQIEATDLPKQQELRKQGKLVDQVIRGTGGEVDIVPTLLEDILLGKDRPVSMEVMTYRGVEKFAFNPETQAWTNIATSKVFAKIPTTKELEEGYALPGGLSVKEIAKRVGALQEIEVSGVQFNPREILGQPKEAFQFPTIDFGKVVEATRAPYEALWGGAPQIKVPEFKMPELPKLDISLPEFKLPSLGSIGQTVSSIARAPYEALWGGAPQISLPSFDLGKTISTVTQKASDIWGKAKETISGALSKLKFW